MSELNDQLARLERIAAEQLHDIDGRDPVQALRTLPEVIEGAADISSALPETQQATENSAMERIGQISRTIGQVLQSHSEDPPHRHWDDGLLPVAEALTATEHLAPRCSDPTDAQYQLVQIVHLSAHTARLRVAHELAGVQGRGQDRALLQRGLAEATAIDELAGSHLRRQQSKRHQKTTGVKGAYGVDLGLALARWDIAIGRAIANADDPSTLIHVATGQSMTYQALGPVLRAVAPADPHVELLTDRIADTGRAWADLSTFWQDLQTPRASPTSRDHHLIDAHRALHATLRELLISADGHVRPVEETVALLDVPDTLENVHQFLASTTAHARTVDHITGTFGKMSVGARAAQGAVMRHLAQEEDPNQFLPADDSAIIDPRDLMLNRAIPLPPALHGTARQHSSEVVRTSAAAFHASGLVPSPSRAQPYTPAFARRSEHVAWLSHSRPNHGISTSR
ncbi:hypothetical protein [uncultured Serinicoccus sp.]|uniref:hypothetical protein n=1 Tax=uncultured Serinicoccus sp. TaxID=735514 RepID=UPI00260E1FE1|nr:hypothetical protein [uncultured Serinicoccus sp.]